MRNRFTALLAFVTIIVCAQTAPPMKRTCATVVPGAAWDTWFNAKVEEFKKNNSAQKENASYIIPVVFHVIYGTQPVGTFPNLSQVQINSQIDILNDDFAGTGYHVEDFANTNFNQWLVANCNVRFCLADKDPFGMPLDEKGINRMSYSDMGWDDPATFSTSATFRNYIDNTVKTNTIWDPERYLNIWITDVNPNVGLLGYATFPPSSGLTGLQGAGTTSDDGVWCWSKAIGDVGTVVPYYNKGRTATHEIGHYLGLRHIWGDANCGTDYCNDTPTQQQENTNCPTYPHTTCNNGPRGDMFMNFMDYCFDGCLYMFTNDQRTRMQTALANSPLRKMLSSSAATLCSAECSYTVSNFSRTDTLLAYRRATASPEDIQCPPGPGRAGYISGTNCYGDKEKAEFISASRYNNLVNPYITSVIVLFFQYQNSGTDGTSSVGLNIYNGHSATTAPGSLIGSATENLSTVAAGTATTNVPYCGNPALSYSQPLILPYRFTFANPVPAPQYDGFYASVVLPALAGDTVTIMDKYTGTSNTAWEKWSDNSWHDMKIEWGGSRNFNLAILPVVECMPVGIQENRLLKDNITLFPNPSNGNFTIITTFPASQNIHVNVYNLLGELVYADSIRQARQNVIEVNMQGKPEGIYLVEVTNGQEKTVKRVVISK